MSRKERAERIAAVIDAGSDYRAIAGEQSILVAGIGFFEMYDIDSLEGSVFKVADEIVNHLNSRK